MNEKKVSVKEYRKFQQDYATNPGQLRFGQAFCSLFYPDHSCINGCQLEELYYMRDRKIAEIRIHANYLDWNN